MLQQLFRGVPCTASAREGDAGGAFASRGDGARAARATPVRAARGRVAPLENASPSATSGGQRRRVPTLMSPSATRSGRRARSRRSRARGRPRRRPVPSGSPTSPRALPRFPTPRRVLDGRCARRRRDPGAGPDTILGCCTARALPPSRPARRRPKRRGPHLRTARTAGHPGWTHGGFTFLVDELAGQAYAHSVQPNGTWVTRSSPTAEPLLTETDLVVAGVRRAEDAKCGSAWRWDGLRLTQQGRRTRRGREPPLARRPSSGRRRATRRDTTRPLSIR